MFYPLNHSFKHKHLWVKNATGLGITEFMLRFMAWLCLCNNGYHGSQMVIVTGPNQDIAIKLIKRIKASFRESEQQEVRHVSERYIAKSNPFIVMVSTPNKPEGLFQQIEKELEESCIYKRIPLDYKFGLGKIYTVQEIENAKRSPSFPREYELQYQGIIGMCFLH
jgi:hypothetical protein